MPNSPQDTALRDITDLIERGSRAGARRRQKYELRARGKGRLSVLRNDQAAANHMRQYGRIDTWQDDRGFGFITSDGGSQRIFVHIKSFSKRGRRPSAGTAVTYLVRRRSRRPSAGGAGRVRESNGGRHGIARPDLCTGTRRRGAWRRRCCRRRGEAAGVGDARLRHGKPDCLSGLRVRQIRCTTRSLARFRADAAPVGAGRRLAGRAHRPAVAATQVEEGVVPFAFWGTVVLNAVALGWLYPTSAA